MPTARWSSGCRRTLARRAPPSRAKRERMIAPALLFAAGLARMDRVDHERHRKHDVRNVRYRDGLMMAILAARAFRRGNLHRCASASTSAGSTASTSAASAPPRPRTAAPLVEPLPAALTPYIDRYLAEVRPALLRGHVSDAFWVSTYRGALSEQSIYTKVCAATEEELGIKLQPAPVPGCARDRHRDRRPGAHPHGVSAARSCRSAHDRAPLHPRPGDHRQPALQRGGAAAPGCGGGSVDRPGGFFMRAVDLCPLQLGQPARGVDRGSGAAAAPFIERQGWTLSARLQRPGDQRRLDAAARLSAPARRRRATASSRSSSPRRSTACRATRRTWRRCTSACRSPASASSPWPRARSPSCMSASRAR